MTRDADYIIVMFRLEPRDASPRRLQMRPFETGLGFCLYHESTRLRCVLAVRPYNGPEIALHFAFGMWESRQSVVELLSDNESMNAIDDACTSLRPSKKFERARELQRLLGGPSLAG